MSATTHVDEGTVGAALTPVLALLVAFAVLAHTWRGVGGDEVDDPDRGLVDVNDNNHAPKSETKPISVNYHFTRSCNYECGFCFHTAKNSAVEPLDSMKQAFVKLKNAGCRKINFSGGEPFLHARQLGEMVEHCKAKLKFESVSIVSNGSLIKRDWFEKYGSHLDILAISCDSFDPATNMAIGRKSKATAHKPEAHCEQLKQVREWCTEFNVLFKLNTVVNSKNVHENMSSEVTELKPHRWKVFQVLALEGENHGPNALRKVQDFLISTEQFNAFVDLHRAAHPDLVVENNATMKDSYLILDEHLRFLNCTGGGKVPSESISKVSVSRALTQAGFDEDMFRKRNGVYQWTRPVAASAPLCGEGGGGGETVFEW